ncbi:MAG: excinuclease ABC subunit UvrC [Planctomycetota bacterium]|nr:excinuclease ABC subunit UvrC [Planctomycetota bacterium]
MNPAIHDKTARFPDGPGVYLFLGAARQALYVGKAANLRARVRSYLKPGGDGRVLLRFLEDEACDVEFLATDTEQEAMLLENTVIKKHKPRYNLKLKDDKAFLLLRLDLQEDWPWYRLVRRRRDDGALYFGPYASAKAVRRTLRLLHKIVPLRDCSDHVFHNRSRPCIKHQIGRCPAPCVGMIDKDAYEELLQRSLKILRGDTASLLRDLRAAMAQAAEKLEFERAQSLHQQIEALQSTGERQAVVGKARDEDVLGVHRAGDEVNVAFLTFRDGALETCRRHSFRSELPMELLVDDLLGRFYEGDQYVPPVVLVPELPLEADLIGQWLRNKRGAAVELLVPQRGDRRRHLELARQNAELADALLADARARRQVGAQKLAGMLNLPDVPMRMHCIDVSTTQGVKTTASRVCFQEGEPYRRDYRKFKISAEHAGDDFSAMQEAVRRSLTLCLEREGESLPDLLIVDGGKGQLDAARRAIAELGLDDDLAVCGLAKRRAQRSKAGKAAVPERIYVADRSEPQELAEGAPETLLITAIRDEAHRFAISFHRQLRGRIGSELDEVPGIGPSRRRTLLRHFGSLSELRAASLEDVRAVPGLPGAVADAVYERLHRK